jgi:branched-chain amino acid aminotransferase
VTRALLLAWCPEIREERLTPADLASADEVFLTSSTRDVQGVHSVDGRRPGGDAAPAPGPITMSAASAFAEKAAINPDPS